MLHSERVAAGANARRARRIKTAEVMSSFGAGVLGAALGALTGTYLRQYVWWVLTVGLLLHALGMWDKHRLEREAGAEPLRWVSALYWLCWLALAAVALLFLLKGRSSLVSA